MFKKQLLYRMTRLCEEIGVEVVVSPDERLSIPLVARIKAHQCPAMGTRGRSEYLNQYSVKIVSIRGCDGMRIYGSEGLFKNQHQGTSMNNFMSLG